jgi:hypothetical protein
MSDKDNEKSENKTSESKALLKHELLGAYFLSSSGITEINDDPNLIEDNSYIYPNDLNAKIEESLIVKGELKRYKTKTGVFKGYPADVVIQITKKGIEAYLDEKYFKEWLDEKLKKTSIDTNEAVIKQYQEQLKVNESIIETNNNVKTTNETMKKIASIQILISVVTIIIAGLAAWVSWLGYKSNTNEDLNIRLKSLETKEAKTEQQVQQIQQPTIHDSVHKIIKKDSSK